MANEAIVIVASLILVFLVIALTYSIRSQKIRKLIQDYKESASEEIKIIQTLLPTYRISFGEGYSSSGLLLCSYAHVLGKGTLENLNSRNKLELPSSPEEIKKAIIEIAESIILEGVDEDSPVDLLKMAYTSLASFLPESKAQIVTERNRGWLSEDLNHPGLRRFEKAEQIDAEVQAEEKRLSDEFDEIITDLEERQIEYLKNRRAELLRQKEEALQKLAEVYADLNSDTSNLEIETKHSQ